LVKPTQSTETLTTGSSVLEQLQKLRIGTGWETFKKFRQRRLSGLMTGIEVLDRAMLGLPPILTLQGGPGSCKSALSLQIARNVASRGCPVFIHDFENGRERLRTRLVCQTNMRTWIDVLTAPESEEARWSQAVKDLPIYVTPEPPGERDEHLATLRELAKQHKKPVLLVVDSIQALPKIPGDSEGRTTIEYWMQYFDQLKLRGEGWLYILLVSEKKRGAYDEARMDGGKGSNAIEYKSEVLLDMRAGEGGTVIVQCQKFRDGQKDFRIDFEKVMADGSPSSFTYELRPQEEL
jgi:KaiC/GvpD/RAD55 family RecA-like ATPase